MCRVYIIQKFLIIVYVFMGSSVCTVSFLCCWPGEVMEGSSGSEDEEDDKGEAAAEDPKQNDANTK